MRKHVSKKSRGPDRANPASASANLAFADISCQLAQAVEFSSDLIALVDRQGKFLFANQAFVRGLGYPREELLGRHYSSTLSPENPPDRVEEFARAMDQYGAWQGECLLRSASGRDLLLFMRLARVRDEYGVHTGSIGIGHDIREQKQIEETLRRTEEQFRDLVDHVRVIFFVGTSNPFSLTYVSPAYETITGHSCNELLERAISWVELVHPDDRARVEAVLADAFLGRETFVEYRFVRPDGTHRWMSAHSYPVRDSRSKVLRLVGIAEDITERVSREKALTEAHDKLNLALAASEQMSHEAARLSDLVDILQSCQTLDEAYKVIQGAVQTALGAPSGALYITSASRNVLEAVASWGLAAECPTAFHPEECWALRRGKPHRIVDPVSPVRCAHIAHPAPAGSICLPLVAQGETLGILYLEPPEPLADAPARPPMERDALLRQAVAFGERISLAIANLNLREILRRQSIRDPLTGLFNRRYMEESLERELSRCARTGESVALLLFDIDHFKRFNDVFGHQAGDRVLRVFGELLNQRTRGQDVACRYGGEEFALILAGASLENAHKRAEILRADLSRMVVEHGGQPLEKITVSIGVAASPDQGLTSEEIIRGADRALYRAKAEGRDRIVIEETKVAST